LADNRTEEMRKGMGIGPRSGARWQAPDGLLSLVKYMNGSKGASEK